MERTHIFDAIEEGMPVLQESDKEQIGTVEFVRYGEGTSSDIDLPSADTIMKTLADIFDPDTNYPDEVYERLYAEGYIRVERGLEPDAFVLPNQIEHIVDGEVHISVSEEDLFTE